MKRLLALLLALLMLLSVCACTADGTDEPNAPTPPASDGNNDAEQPTIDPFTDPNTSFTIVYPEAKRERYAPFADKLRLAIAEKTGVTVGVAGDYTPAEVGEGIKNDRFEILLGDTNRAESAKVDTPKGSFVIKIDGNKIVIVGETDDHTFKGVLHFIDNCIGSSEQSTLFNVTSDYSHEQSTTVSVALYMDLGENVLSDVLTPKVIKIFDPQRDKNNKMTLTAIQGGCTDGEYFYLLLTDGTDNENDQTRVVKFDPRTNMTVKVGPLISVAHANDLTYDSKNNRLLAAWCSVDFFKVSYIDLETLDVTGTGTITGHDFGCFGIAYDPVTNTYACAESSYKLNGYGLLVLDEDLKLIRRMAGGGIGHTAQGIDGDDKYIYYAQSPGGGNSNNVIRVHDRETGKLVKQFTVDLGYEIENVFWYDGAFYAGFNCHGSGTLRRLYKLDLNFN